MLRNFAFSLWLVFFLGLPSMDADAATDAKHAELVFNYLTEKFFDTLDGEVYEDRYERWALAQELANAWIGVRSIADPSICYHLDLVNPTDQPQNVFFSFDMPVDPIGANTATANLRLELRDTNEDGSASITADFGPLDTLVRAFIVTTDQVGIGPTVDVGETSSGAGVYTFQAGPIQGPVAEDADELNLVASFVLSPGDSVNLQGNVVLDTGSGEPVCSIPVRFVINPGLNGSWFNPATNFQGFLFDVFPDQGVMSAAWFTYATELPPPDDGVELGDPSQRWMIGIGPYTGNTATLDISQFSGGVFDSGSPVPEQSADGTMTVEFTDCNNGKISYSIDSIDQSGVIPITRIASDNVPLCEALIEIEDN